MKPQTPDPVHALCIPIVFQCIRAMIKSKNDAERRDICLLMAKELGDLMRNRHEDIDQHIWQKMAPHEGKPLDHKLAQEALFANIDYSQFVSQEALQELRSDPQALETVGNFLKGEGADLLASLGFRVMNQTQNSDHPIFRFVHQDRTYGILFDENDPSSHYFWVFDVSAMPEEPDPDKELSIVFAARWDPKARDLVENSLEADEEMDDARLFTLADAAVECLRVALAQ